MTRTTLLRLGAATLTAAVTLSLVAVSTHSAEAARRKRGWTYLFDGKSLKGWHLRHERGANGWKVENGLLVNTPPSTDLVSDAKFQDFDLHVEYMFPKGSNSGLYLRGRYEVQIDDAHGAEPNSHRSGGVYGRITPTSNPTKRAGEWQVLDARLIGRRVTVVLNGVRIIDNQEIPGVTGAALDDREDEPGPLMLQGDHGGVTFREIRIKPIRPRRR
jgi:hypothetical protein